MRQRSERTGAIAYQPALDGVRALAVVAVLLFHAEVRGFSGGYLGVSVFFTLSGYLITSLLLAEHAATGTISKSGFYARRVRRLLPASLACLGAIIGISVVSDVFDSVANLRREVIGALLQVSNWVFLAGEGSYQQLFQQTGGGRSPVEHFWSLSIEEQFYWVWPPAMALILGRWASKRSRTAVLTFVTLVFVVAAPVTAAVFGPDAAYWATPARVGEILIGALLALVLSGRRVPQPVAWLAPLALLALAICVVTFPAAGGPAYDGWLPAVAVGSATLVFGLQVDSPLRRTLSTRPLVWLGGISYGVYVYHWPIYVIADEGRTGLDGWRLLAFRLACTLVIAELSYRLLEQPIRRAHGARRRTTLVGGAVATSAVAAAAVLVVPSALGEYWRVNDTTVAAAAIHVDGSPLAPLTTEPPPSSPRLRRRLGRSHRRRSRRPCLSRNRPSPRRPSSRPRPRRPRRPNRRCRHCRDRFASSSPATPPLGPPPPGCCRGRSRTPRWLRSRSWASPAVASCARANGARAAGSAPPPSATTGSTRSSPIE